MGEQHKMPNTSSRRRAFLQVAPKELVTMGGTAVAALAVVATGAGIAAALPDPASPWLVASAYLAPASIAFAAYWWIAQKL
jgi:hypothetical protein